MTKAEVEAVRSTYNEARHAGNPPELVAVTLADPGGLVLAEDQSYAPGGQVWVRTEDGTQYAVPSELVALAA